MSLCLFNGVIQVMFLKKIVINGFKSFCDPSEINFDKGISAIVGPNGCGKSNIVDALKWVLGEQKNRSLRANNMTDVIFKGTVDKKGLSRAEVRLTVVNDDNILPLEFNEVEVARIIYADGENEYYINKEKVRLKDIHELFYDTGVGKSAYSFMEQGRIDMILSNKPEDRRYIIEEAAGITKYKSRKNDALLKLAKADENILRVQDILAEVSKQYENMKKQAEKAEKYKLIHDRELELEIEVNVNRLMTQKEIKNNFSTKLESIAEELAEIKEKVNSLEGDVADKMLQLNQLGTEKIDNNRELIQLEGEIKLLNSRSSMFRDKVTGLSASLKSDEDKIALVDRKLLEVEEEMEEVDESKYEVQERISGILKDIERYEENRKQIDIDIQRIEENALGKKRDIENQGKELEEKRTHLKEITDQLIVKIEDSLNRFDLNSREIVTLKENISSDIENVLKEFRIRRNFLEDMISVRYLPSHSEDFFAKLEEFYRQLKDTETKLASAGVNVSKYVKATEIFMNDIFSPEGMIQQKRKIEHEIATINEKIKVFKVEMEQFYGELDLKEGQKEKYKELASESKVTLSTLREKQNSIERDLQRIQHMRAEYKNSKSELQKSVKRFQEELEEVYGEIDETEYAAAEAVKRKNGLEQRIEELDRTIQAENSKMSEQQKHIREINEAYMAKKESVDRFHIKLAEVDATISSIYDNFYENLSINLKDYENKEQYKTNRDYSQIRSELAELKTEKGSLGSVNLLAIEECKSLEERHSLLVAQLDDLKIAKKDLLRVIDELNSVSEELFVKTYHEIRKNFQAIFAKLFDGGRADILLTMPDHILETGIDITAQPPGQTSKSITLLSGGQRTMTAIALMFATFQVKPSPFCLLDEIDAALDEANVIRFIGLLQEFKEQSQFVMITHNKKTMSAANVLYGVTQESMGVSKIVSAKFIEKAV